MNFTNVISYCLRQRDFFGGEILTVLLIQQLIHIQHLLNSFKQTQNVNCLDDFFETAEDALEGKKKAEHRRG